MREPQTISARESMATCGRSGAPELVVVSGPLGTPAARQRALHLAARHEAPVLKIAVLHGPDSDTGAVINEELMRGFDSVFRVGQTAGADLVRRLIHALVTPGEPTQVIGCDWNDVCHIVAGAADVRVAGYGFGRAAGPGRAALAVLAALEQIAGQGVSLKQARGVCIAITAARANLLGSELKEVLSHVRSRVDPSVTIAQAIDFDDVLGQEAMEVDMFVFGASCPPPLSSSGAVPPAWTAIAGAGVGRSAHSADPLYDIAKSLVLGAGQASISLIQRTLRIPYSHASRLLDAMEGDILSSTDENGMRTLHIAMTKMGSR